MKILYEYKTNNQMYIHIYISYEIFGLQPSHHVPRSGKENTGGSLDSTRRLALGVLGVFGQQVGLSPPSSNINDQ